MKEQQISLGEVNDIATQLLSKAGDCSDYPEDIPDLCDILSEKIEEKRNFNVIVMGSFSRGKSTFLNAIIGEKLLFSHDREATGALTYIVRSEEKNVYVDTVSGRKQIPLTGNYLEQIKEYTDKQNNPQSNRLIVAYPIKGFDSDLCFVDTPGLAGLDDEQKKVTSKAVRSADAVIVLVGINGLDETEIEFLTGNLEGLEEIRTCKLIMVMNKITDINHFAEMTYEEQESRIHICMEEIRRNMADHGIDRLYSSIQLFAIDSRDALRGFDNNVYNEYNRADPEMSQKELLERSRFLPFRDTLTELLESDNRTQDIKRNTLKTAGELCDRLIEYYKTLSDQSFSEYNKKLGNLDGKLKRIETNKRKYLSNLAGRIRNGIDAFNKAQKDVADDRKKKLKEETDRFICQEFNTIASFEKNSSEFDRLCTLVKDDIDKFIDIINSQADTYYRGLLDGIKEDVELKLKKDTGQQVEIDIEIKPPSVNLHKIPDLKETNQLKILDNIINELKRQQSEKESERNRMEYRLSNLDREKDEKIRNGCFEAEEKKKKLGPEPPSTKEECIEKEPIKILGFITIKRKSEYREVPNEELYEYKEEFKAIEKKLRKKIKDIEEDYSYKEKQIGCEIDEINEELTKLEREIREKESEYRRKRDLYYKKSEEVRIDHQKQNLTYSICEQIDIVFRGITDEVNVYGSAKRGEIVDQIEKKIGQAAETYKKNLEKQREEYIAHIQRDYVNNQKKHQCFENISKKIKKLEEMEE